MLAIASSKCKVLGLGSASLCKWMRREGKPRNGGPKHRCERERCERKELDGCLPWTCMALLPS